MAGKILLLKYKELDYYISSSVLKDGLQINVGYKLWLHDVAELVEFSDSVDLSENENLIVGGKLLSLELRQQVYNFWKPNSTVSVHGSIERHNKNE